MSFIDGSFVKNSSGQVKSGVRGFLINNRRLCKLVFSGPVEAQSGYDAEAKALVLMMSHLLHNRMGICRA